MNSLTFPFFPRPAEFSITGYKGSHKVLVTETWTGAADRALGVVKGMTDDEAAQRLAVSESTVNRWRELRDAGQEVPEPRGKPRTALLRFLVGDSAGSDESGSDFYDRESRAAAERSTAMRIDAETRKVEAEAALERAKAQRLAEENARELRMARAASLAVPTGSAHPTGKAARTARTVQLSPEPRRRPRKDRPHPEDPKDSL